MIMKMKTSIFNALMSLALLAGFTACNEKWEPDGPATGSETGTLSTADLALDITNIEQITESRASRASIDLSNYIITVQDAAGAVVNEWTYSTMPGLPMFAVGDYTLVVESHQPESAAWEMPHFKGTKTFSIQANKVTSIGTVTCSLQSLKVTVNFSNDLVKAGAGDLKCVVDVHSNGILEFGQNETRAAYFVVPEGNTTMVATFTGTVNGYNETIIRTYNNIQNAVGKHFVINFSLKGGGEVVPPAEQGQWDPTEGINVDMDVISSDLSGNANPGDEEILQGTRPGDEEWPEEPVDPVDPTPPGPGDDDPAPAATFYSATLNLNGVNTCDVSPAAVTITCPKGVAHLYVTIDSTTLDEAALSDVGLSKNFDLAYPANEDQASSLRDDLGFTVGEDIIGRTEVVFDITGFVPMLGALGSGDHNFILEVVDSEGAMSSQTLKFKS